MRTLKRLQFTLALLALMTLLLPTAALAMGDGKKHFKKGLDHEAAEEWDQAAEEFALAVADNPKNPEYRLHYVRALFNASQMFMKRGRVLAEQEDYVGAYNAFRKAYGFDPVNELAKSEMARMLRQQKALLGGDDGADGQDDVSLVKTGFNNTTQIPDDVVIPQRYEKLRDLPFPSGIDLQRIVRDLARDLDLNVLFDSASRLENKKIKIELKNVTAAQALDAIFLQEGLFFEKVGPRTIIVANSNRRQFFQQLVLRTFYLGNADPTKVANVIQKAIPAQPGRTPTIVLTDEDTNSVTIRDTAENIRLMSRLIAALDKDRAEVVMDVQIFEVSRNDLLQLGNQIGSQTSLTALGGSSAGIVRVADAPQSVFGNIPLNSVFGAALAIPASSLAAFQRKNNTKLIASTQIHAFNNEDSSARIGQRVPVQTASVIPFTNTNTPSTPGNAFGNGYPVINYEQVGLTLKFKPIVFPNQDVQVAMEIESKDVIDASTLTPTFTERTIKGTARVQNNKTLLLASVAQGVESRGREGIPLLGLIPILGRLFTAPTRDNRQVDIVIAVTPRVIRAPAILPEDTVEMPSGSLAVPTPASLEALIIQEEVDKQLALAKRQKRNADVQLPDADVPQYVKSDGSDTVSQNDAVTDVPADSGSTDAVSESLGVDLKPIDTGVSKISIDKSVRGDASAGLEQTSLPATAQNDQRRTLSPDSVPVKTSLQILPKLPSLKRGETAKLAVMVRSGREFRSALLGLNFDPSLVRVKEVTYGELFGAGLQQQTANPFHNSDGKMYVTLAAGPDGLSGTSGVLAYIEIEALSDGIPDIGFDGNMLNLLTAGGELLEINY